MGALRGGPRWGRYRNGRYRDRIVLGVGGRLFCGVLRGRRNRNVGLLAIVLGRQLAELQLVKVRHVDGAIGAAGGGKYGQFGIEVVGNLSSGVCTTTAVGAY